MPLYARLKSAFFAHEVQMIVSFIIGMLFAPWSYGIFFLLAFTVIYEILYYLYVDKSTYIAEVRAGISLASICGWVTGRTLYELDIHTGY